MGGAYIPRKGYGWNVGYGPRWASPPHLPCRVVGVKGLRTEGKGTLPSWWKDQGKEIQMVELKGSKLLKVEYYERRTTFMSLSSPLSFRSKLLALLPGVGALATFALRNCNGQHEDRNHEQKQEWSHFTSYLRGHLMPAFLFTFDLHLCKYLRGSSAAARGVDVDAACKGQDQGPRVDISWQHREASTRGHHQ